MRKLDNKSRAVLAGVAVFWLAWLGFYIQFIYLHSRFPIGHGDFLNWLFGLGG